MRELRHDEDGVGLVELLVVMVLIGVLGAIVTNVVIGGLRTSHYAQTRVTAVADTQMTIERVSRELRAADPLRRADPDSAWLDVRRAGRLYHYRYDTLPNGDGTFRFVERRFVFEDPAVFDAIGFDPAVATPAADQSRVLVDRLEGAAVFRHLNTQGEVTAVPSAVVEVEILLDRVIDDIRPPVRVETAVKVRNA